ncbi:MAG: hypothetical protein H0U57_03455 [Tatlockia sp.]|nr:hypothetical protein [Tatlockia sp.]
MQDKKLSQQFRCALRKLNASNLETLLFGNTSDDLTSSYKLPDDDEISQLFHTIDKQYCFFTKDNIANKQFAVFFLMCKLIADFFEKNNDEKDTVAAEHAYKLLVFFGYNKNGNPFMNVGRYLTSYQCYQQVNPIHDTLAAHQLPYPENQLNSQDIKGWQILIMKSRKSALNYFQLSLAFENVLHRAPVNIEEAKKVKAQFNYKNYDAYPTLANLCMQSIGGNSEQCVIDGITLLHNGYVLLKGKPNQLPIINGKINPHFHIVGAAYTWLNPTKDVLVLDSWENLRNKDDRLEVSLIEGFNVQDDDDIFVKMKDEFGRQLTQKSEIISIRIGGGGKTPKALCSLEVPSEKMLEGTQYPDSQIQFQIYVDVTKALALKSALQEKWMQDEYKFFGMEWDKFCEFIKIDNLGTRSEINAIEELFLKTDKQLIKNIFNENIIKKSLEINPALDKDSCRKILFKIINLIIKYIGPYDPDCKTISIILESNFKHNYSRYYDRLCEMEKHLPAIQAKFNEKGMLAYKVFEVLEYPDQLLRILIDNETLLTSKVFLQIFKNRPEILDSLILLNIAGLLTDITAEALVQKASCYDDFGANRLITLLSSSLLTPSELEMLVSFKVAFVLYMARDLTPEANYLPIFRMVNALKKLLPQKDIFSQGIKDISLYGRFNQFNPENYANCLLILHKKGLLTNANQTLLKGASSDNYQKIIDDLIREKNETQTLNFYSNSAFPLFKSNDEEKKPEEIVDETQQLRL